MILTRWVVVLIAIVALMGAGCTASSNSASAGTSSTPTVAHNAMPTSAPVGYSMASVKDVEGWLDAGEKMTIIDLREPILFEDGHIPGAKNIDFSDFEKRMKELSPDAKIVLVCHTGPMGDSAAGLLAKNGYTKVWNVDGGMAAWTGKREK